LEQVIFLDSFLIGVLLVVKGLEVFTVEQKSKKTEKRALKSQK